MKIDRLLGMTVLLLNRGRISAKELADRFEVSTKTVYRDMETLSHAGIPIAAYQGTTGGFEIMENFTIARQLLTLKEISSIITAVKGASTAMDDYSFTTLLEKLKALLYKSQQKSAEELGAGIIFDFNPWGQGPFIRDKVNILKQATEEARCVEINYLNRNGTDSTRVIEPYALILKGQLWYLQAYCRLREEFRVFRLSRIQDMHQLQGGHFERRQAPSMEGLVWDTEWTKGEEIELVLLFRKEIRYRVSDTFHPDQITILHDGAIRLRGLFIADEWLYGMLLSYGDNVKVEQPAFVAEELVKRLRQMLERYSN